jgi:hypothetical protein
LQPLFAFYFNLIDERSLGWRTIGAALRTVALLPDCARLDVDQSATCRGALED